MNRYPPRPVRAGLFVALGLLLAPPPAGAATPRDEALRLVPDDVGFCLVVQDLRGHAGALADSPFLEELHKSPLGQALHASPELAKLRALGNQVRKDLQVDWPRLRDDIFGDAVVFAYRPGPPGEPKQDGDLVVIRARDAQLLAQVLDRVNEVQKRRKEVTELEARSYEGRTYYRRVDRGRENYYFLHGPILALSSREEMLRRAIDLDRQAGDEEPAVARQLRRLGADRRLAALWINPRAFDAEVARKAEEATGPEAAVTRAFLSYWKALDGAALSFDMQADAEWVLAVRADAGRLPPAAQKFFATAARPSELWERFPDNALLAAAGRVDFGALLEMLGDFLTTEDRDNMLHALQGGLGAGVDKDVVKDILPFVGPDVGLCVTAPGAADHSWVPQVVLAVRVRPGDRGAPVDQALLSVVKSYAFLAVIDHNRQHKDQLSLKTEHQDEVEVKYLAGDSLPAGLNPAFALKDGYLVLASSPEAVRRFGRPAAEVPRDAGGPFPLLRLSLGELRRYVQERREPLAQATAEKNGMTPEEAEKRLNGLLLGLQFFDRAEVSHAAGDGQITLTLRLQPSRPFRK
jgi:hypothetical protein